MDNDHVDITLDYYQNGDHVTSEHTSLIHSHITRIMDNQSRQGALFIATTIRPSNDWDQVAITRNSDGTSIEAKRLPGDRSVA